MIETFPAACVPNVTQIVDIPDEVDVKSADGVIWGAIEKPLATLVGGVNCSALYCSKLFHEFHRPKMFT